jgi:hypothetical protein
MKIDSTIHITIDEAAKELKASRRAIYRMMARAEEAGEKNVFVEAFGRTFLVRSRLGGIAKKYYFPRGSEQRSRLAKKWGSMGGSQKRINREQAAGA